MGVLGAAVVPGLAVRVGAEVLATVWLGDWPAGPLVRRRQKRRALADAEVQAQVVALGVAEDRQRQDEIKAARDAMREAEVRRDNIALVVPARATRMGDRVHAMEERVQRYYRVPLGLLWPRVWLTASEPQRVEVRETAGAFDASTRLGAWGLLYVVGGAATLWWPASAAGAVAVAASWWTGRQRLFALADLVESLVDLRIGPVARMVGVASKDGPLPEVVGDELNLLMKRLRLPREPEAP